MRASRQIHGAFHPGRADTPIRLRISLNTGPCIAVQLNANADFDFFGGTVNVAAKLQTLAEGYQIAMSDATYHAPGVAAYLAEQGAELETLSYTSPALPDPVGVRQWTVYREGES